MKPIVQEESTGCAIASVAAVAGVSYQAVKRVANNFGIFASDRKLWSDTTYVRKLLSYYKMKTASSPRTFQSWASLPDVALLAIKWHAENGRPFWHWVVFVRQNGSSHVFDSKKSLRHHIRTDFGRIKPKWYLEVIR